MSEGPQTKTVEETQTSPRDENRNEGVTGTAIESDDTASGTGVTSEADPEKFVDQMSHADHPSNDSRTEDPGV